MTSAVGSADVSATWSTVKVRGTRWSAVGPIRQQLTTYDRWATLSALKRKEKAKARWATVPGVGGPWPITPAFFAPSLSMARLAYGAEAHSLLDLEAWLRDQLRRAADPVRFWRGCMLWSCV
jgi:hypothetical protein